MKCKFCGGSGKDNWMVGTDFLPCPVCNGTGEIKEKPMTNEEWFATLSTEEKAMAIVLCCPYEADWFGENFKKRMEQRMKNLSQSAYGYEKGINKIKEWLKKPHREIGK